MGTRKKSDNLVVNLPVVVLESGSPARLLQVVVQSRGQIHEPIAEKEEPQDYKWNRSKAVRMEKQKA